MRLRVPEGVSPISYMARLSPAMFAAEADYTDAVYANTTLPVRMFEAVRMRIAQLNGCEMCLAYRTPRDRDGWGQHEVLDEEFYTAVGSWRDATAFSERERLAIELAERFACDHRSLDGDDGFWEALHERFTDAELLQLVLSAGAFVVGGRMMHLFGVDVCDLPARWTGRPRESGSVAIAVAPVGGTV